MTTYKNIYRSRQGSNLRGQSPLDFKSNALDHSATTALGVS